MRRRKGNKQRKILVISFIGLLFIMTVGYAAFNTNLSIMTKGNLIKVSPNVLKSKYCNTTSGDGLYVDEFSEGHCIYKGDYPNNYILFNDDIYRIIAIEENGSLKIMKQVPAATNINYDYNDKVSRYNDGTYCNDKYGCNVWSNKNNTYDSVGNKVTEFYGYTLPSSDCTANRFLNSLGEYENSGFYNNLKLESKSLIMEHNFSIGYVSKFSTVAEVVNSPISEIMASENAYIWKGKVGLLNGSDLLKSIIGDSSYIFRMYTWNWFINPVKGIKTNQQSSFHFGELITLTGVIYYGAGSGVGLSPVMFLKPDITLSGKGTSENPYTIN